MKHFYHFLLVAIIVIAFNSKVQSQYCTPSSTMCDEYIKQVICGNINNYSYCSTGGYTDYTPVSGTAIGGALSVSTVIAQGATQTITVENGLFYNGDYVDIWIDFNHNNNFTDPGEHVVNVFQTSATTNTSFTVPGGALIGSTRMRVCISYYSTTQPCGNIYYGEYEDYNLIIINGSAFTPSPTSASANPTSISIGNSSTLTATGISGTLYWFSGSCGGTFVGTGSPLVVNPVSNTTYYARNYNNYQFSSTCANASVDVNSSTTPVYIFRSYTDTYTPITGGTVLWSGYFDDNLSTTISIPGFRYNGEDFSSLNVAANGFVTFGTNAPYQTLYSPISDSSSNKGFYGQGVISPFGSDLQSAASGSPEISYKQENNEFIIQWQDVRRYIVTNEILSFQIRLNLNLNTIKIVYGGTIIGGIPSGYIPPLPEVGLRGALLSDYNVRTVSSTGTWDNTSFGEVNHAKCYFGPGVTPSSGLTFEYIPEINNCQEPDAYNYINYSTINIPTCLAEEGNYIWVGTSGGICKRNKSNGTVAATYRGMDGLCGMSVSSIAVDNLGVKWITTLDGGVSKFNGATWTTYNVDNSGIESNTVNYCAIDFSGNKWFGVEDKGLIKFDGTTWTKVLSATTTDWVSIKTITFDNFNNVWIGDEASGVGKFDGTNWTYYTTSNSSLANDSINSINFDMAGNAWISTNNGLSKYDGTNWTNFSSGKISQVAIDSWSNIWFGTNGGVYKNITNYNTSNSNISSNIVNSIIIDASGDKWIATDDGLNRFDDVSWVNYVQNNLIVNNDIWGIAFDDNNNGWFATLGGISKYDGTNWTNYTTANGGPSDYLWQVAIDNNNKPWFVDYYQGVHFYNGITWNSYLASESVWQVAIDNNNIKWFATDGGGVYKFNGITWTNYTTSDGLTSNYVYGVAVDNNNNKWFATSGSGISKFDGTTWTTYDTYNTPELISDDFSTVTVDANGNLWFIYDNYDGFVKFDGQKWYNYNNYFNCGFNYIYPNRGICADNSGNIFYADYYGGGKFDGGRNVIYSDSKIGLSLRVRSVAIDANGNKWYGGADGVTKFSTKTPIANFIDTLNCNTNFVNFYNTSTNIDATTKYRWDVNGDGIFEYGTKNISHKFTTCGTHNVKLIVINENKVDSITKQITIYKKPVVTITYPGNNTICDGTNKVLTANITGSCTPLSYLWSNGGTGSNVSINTSGTYNVTVTNGTCSGVATSQATITVVKPDSTQTICLATVDSATNSNIITWDKTPNMGTFSYNIYKEYYTSNNYVLIGNVPYSQNPIFRDTTSTPSTKAERYTIAVVDTCGNESDKSSAHKTIFLSLSNAGSNINLTWTAYEGYTASYNIYRGTSINNLTYVTTVPSTTTAWTDNNPPSCILYYYISSDKGSSCTTGYNNTMSNIVNNGCTSPPSPSISGNSDICQYQSTQLNAGSGFTSYMWSYNSANTQTISVNTSGTYTVTVTNMCGCAAIDTHSVIVHTPPTITVSSGTTVCSGVAAQLTASGAASYLWSPSTALSATNISNPTAAPTTNTTYFVTGTDAYGCTSTDSVIIGVNPIPTATVTAMGQTTFCYGDSVLLTANTGTNLTYQWKRYGINITGAIGISYYAKQTGDYRVVVTNSNNCSNSSQFIAVTAHTLPNSNITPLSNTTFCQGGSVQLIVSTGPGNTYQWMNNNINISSANGSSYTANQSGSYSMLVTDTNNCSRISSPVTVNINSLPTATLTAGTSTSFCIGDSVVLSSTTGTNYNYKWQRNGITIPLATNSNYVANISGNYSVIITDNNTCSNTSNGIFVNAEPLPNANISNTNPLTFCSGNSVSLSTFAGLGYTYQWKVGNTDISGEINSNYTASTAGVYTVLVTNSNNCSNTSMPVTVNVNPLPTVSITAATASTFCQGDSVVLQGTSSANCTYRWKRNGNLIIPFETNINYTAFQAGIYSLEVTNTNGCVNTSSSLTVTVNSVPNAMINNNGAITLCSGNSIMLNVGAGSGYTYQWKLNGTDILGATGSSISANSGGAYSVNVTDGNNCSVNSNSVTVAINPLPTISISAATSTTFCQGDSVVLNGTLSSNYNYKWKRNGINIPLQINSSFTAFQSGNYSLEVTDTNNCVNFDNQTVTVNSLPSAVISSLGSLSLCSGSSVILSVSAGTGYTYQWMLNGTNILGAIGSTSTATAAGNYSVNIIDVNNCSATSAPVAVTINSLPVSTITTSGVTSFCQGDSVTLNGNIVSGYSYQWYMNGNDIIGETNNSFVATQSGAYSLEVTDANGCDSYSLPINVSVNSYPTSIISVFGGNPVVCNGNAVYLTVDAGLGYSYQWQVNGSDIISANSSSYSAYNSGNYTVEITNSFGCSSMSVAQLVTVNPLPDTSMVSSGATTFCDGSNDTLTVSYNYINSYQWRKNNLPVVGWNNNFAVITQPGIYDVTIINTQTGCFITSNNKSIIVNQNPTPSIQSTGNLTLCIDDSMVLNTMPYASYIWNTNQTSNYIYIKTGGVYSTTVTDNNGCVGSDSITIIETANNAPEICMVTVDTAANKNKIIWEKDTSIHNVKYYKIYKESTIAGQYNFIASIPDSSMSEYIDNTSNPLSHSDRYKLSYIDTCGNETPLSVEHKTLHLSVAQNGSGNGYILNWIDPYEGFTFYSYYIYRGDSMGVITLIDSIQNTLYSYTDTTTIPGKLSYIVSVKKATPCYSSGIAKAVGGPYSESVSNPEDNGIISIPFQGVDQLSIGYDNLKIYPNPMKDNTTVEFSNPLHKEYSLNIIDVTGKVLREIKGIKSGKVEINRDGLSSGFYIIEVTGEKLFRGRIVIDY